MAGAPNWVSLFDHFNIIFLFTDTGVSRSPFVIFSKDGKGNELREDDLFTKLLNHYEIHLTNEEMNEFSQSKRSR
jgi:hypothetical protein